MRTTGKITHWNPDKGYGFITPESAGERVFVHISAFNSRIPPPRVGESVHFVLSTDRQGRPRAEKVLREGETPRLEPISPKKDRQPDARAEYEHPSRPRSSDRPRPAARGRSGRAGSGGSVLLVAALIALGVFSYYKLQQPAPEPDSTYTPFSQPLQAPAPKFNCDGRTHCSHMTSCEEAFYFIEHCPGTQMDGDGDGIPCESQWCG